MFLIGWNDLSIVCTLLFRPVFYPNSHQHEVLFLHCPQLKGEKFSYFHQENSKLITDILIGMNNTVFVF